MFQLFRSRKRTLRIVLAVVVAPIIISMVVTLIPGIFGTTGSDGLSDAVLAEVEGEEVTLREAQFELQDYVQQRKLPPGAFNFIAPKIVEDLVTDKALLHEAERLGLGVTEAELADLLRTSLPFLFQGGSFLGKEQYAAFVQDRFRKSIPEFEAAIRKDLALTKLRRLVTDGVTVSPAEVEQEYRRRNEKAKVEFVTVSPASLQTSVSVTPAEIQQHFENNRALYTLPERRSFQYMVVDDAGIAAKVEVARQELERYYNENRDRFRIQERVRATHILLKTTEKSEDEIKKIEAKAQDVLKQAQAGKDFAELAKAHSEDPASAAKGGEVGFITRGQTVPEFEQKAFSMKPGQLELVKTQYGFHIIKVLEREEARLKPFSEVEATIREEAARDRVEMEKSRLAENARAAANRHAPNLQEAGREVGLPVFIATAVERGASLSGIGNEPALMDSLFATAKGQVVGPIHLAGKSVIAVITDVQPSRQAEFQEVADRVKNDAATAKARQVADARARELVEKAKAAGGDLRRAARDLRLEAKTSDFFTRDGSVPGVGPGSMLTEAFAAAIGTVVGPVGGGEGQIVYKVIDRQQTDASASDEEKKMIREQLVGNRQSEAFEVFKDELRERLKKQGKIKIYQDRVDRFVTANRS